MSSAPTLLLLGIHGTKLVFYDKTTQKNITFDVSNDRKAYCYAYKPHTEDLAKSDDVLAVEPLDTDTDYVKITTKSSQNISLRNQHSIPNIVRADKWYETDIRQHENILWDYENMIPGTWFVSPHTPSKNNNKKQLLLLPTPILEYEQHTADEKEIIKDTELRWKAILNQPVISPKRLAIDIEVASIAGEKRRLPDAGETAITAIGMSGIVDSGDASVGDQSQQESNKIEKTQVVFYLVNENDKEKEDDAAVTNSVEDIAVGKRANGDNGDDSNNNCNDKTTDIKTFKPYTDEAKMLTDAFEEIYKWPSIITYNGDIFDIPFLYERARKLGVLPAWWPEMKIPLYQQKQQQQQNQQTQSSWQQQQNLPKLPPHLFTHLDLYNIFSNKALQLYAFGNYPYENFKLDTVAKTILGEGKSDDYAAAADAGARANAAYCLNDADLTLRLTTFDNNLVITLLLLISRISRMGPADVSRTSISQWSRSMLYSEHRRLKKLIPSGRDLLKKQSAVMDALEKERNGVGDDDNGSNGNGNGNGNGNSSGNNMVLALDGNHIAAEKSSVQTTKFKGGEVLAPRRTGIMFNVAVLDFASLYPSIISVKNISYDTVCCEHESCKKNNPVPIVGHWSCQKHVGMLSLHIGALRNLRVSYYKQRTGIIDQMITRSLKVILNATYGVIGFEKFPLYFLPAAESVTAYGRHIINDMAKYCDKTGLTVIYGDTDSLFIKLAEDKKSEGMLADISKYAFETHGIDFEHEKTYRYLVISKRKKNYFGIIDYPAGSGKKSKLDVKGMAGKKSNTPPFVRELFSEILQELLKVHTVQDMEKAKKRVGDLILTAEDNIDTPGQIPLEKLAFTMKLAKNPGEYAKSLGVPQHVRAARLLDMQYEKDGNKGAKLRSGDRISYIKCKGSAVVPLELSANNTTLRQIDTVKYKACVRSSLGPIIDALQIDLTAKKGQTTLF